MVDVNRVEGVARKICGKLRDTVGGLSGNASTQASSNANQAAGEARNMYGQVVDERRDFTVDQPIAALLAAMGLGVVVGSLIARH